MKRLVLILVVVFFVLIPIASADTAILFPATNNFRTAYTNTGTTVAALKTASGTLGVQTSYPESLYLGSSTTSNQYNYLGRMMFIYPTDTLADDITITGATMSAGIISNYTTLSGGSLGITKFVIDGTITNDDVDNFQDTRYATDIANTALVGGTYKNWTFNSAGISNISKTATSGFYIRTSWDIDGTSPTWASNAKGGCAVVTTTVSPATYCLIVTYTTGGGADTTPPASITNLANNTATCTEINWTWTNPANADYNGTIIWKNGTWLKNTTSTTVFDKWTGLTGGVSYTFSSKTFDNASTPNVNTTFQNMTAVATSCAVAPSASFTVDRTVARIPKAVTVTDTSTNTPTSWQWQWGDGTANSTTQNPTHLYTKRGKYSIDMTATNAGGSGVATTATVRVVGYANE